MLGRNGTEANRTRQNHKLENFLEINLIIDTCYSQFKWDAVDGNGMHRNTRMDRRRSHKAR